MTIIEKILIAIIILLIAVQALFSNIYFLVSNFISLEVVEKIVSILISLIIAGLSIYGVRTWRIELKGKTRFELAKDVLTSIYKIRDRISQLQNPFVSVHEFKDREAPKNYESDKQKQYAESYFAFRNRFKEIQNELDKWYSTKIEVEAIFGKEQRLLLDKINDSISELFRAIKLYHELNYRSNYDEKTDKKYENIIYGIHPGQENTSGLNNDDGRFQKNLEERIQDIVDKFSVYI